MNYGADVTSQKLAASRETHNVRLSCSAIQVTSGRIRTFSKKKRKKKREKERKKKEKRKIIIIKKRLKFDSAASSGG
jgi:hypothetical protein